MATQLPAKLRTADFQRFALRAAQLETAKPAVAYWCEYWIVNQLLAKGLHNADAECLQYTTNLMDKLEQTKAQHASDDAIVDDTAGEAYVEQFGLETFERADRAIRASKVTKQTADTFLAASTFLELLNIWGAPEAEILAKIKYAKWNAGRIFKAIKEGQDPNESNPKPTPTVEEDIQLDPNDPEVQELSEQPPRARQASVEDVPDEQDRIESRLAAQSLVNQSLHPSAQQSARASPAPPEKFDPYPRSGFPYSAAGDNDVSPLEPPEPASYERNNSIGGGYFPEVPTFTSEAQPPTLPTAPENFADSVPPPDFQQHPNSPPNPRSSGDFGAYAAPKVVAQPPAQPQDFYRQPPPQYQPISRQAPTAAYVPVPAPVAAPAQISKQQAYNKDIVAVAKAYNTDDVAIAKAQKHARFAISALNFDDAATAVKELRLALQTLGAE